MGCKVTKKPDLVEVQFILSNDKTFSKEHLSGRQREREEKV